MTGLNLSANNLTGRIPPELGDLSDLETLYLGDNELGGPIPPALGNLGSLTSLDLQDNDLTGRIPADLGDLTDLTTLDLSFNELEGAIPPELASASELRTLRLAGNDLTGSLPPEFGNLVHLQSLWLRSNGLTGPIPPALGQLSQLEKLVLSDNSLAGRIPPELGQLSDLDILWLSHNELTGPIPSELQSLSDLEKLWLSHNQLAGTVPAELGTLDSLAWLLIGDNPLGGPLPLSLKELSLEVLGYDGTNLCVPADETFRAWLDSIPNHRGTGVDCASGNTDRDILMALYNATGGDDWTKNTNWLTEEPIGNWHGVETDSVGRVTVLLLDDNQLAGTIPPELGDLSNLEELRLYGNELTGAIPPELGNLANLERLLLSDNSLTGAIAPELGDLSNLDNLRLNNNDLLSGPLPLELNGLPLEWFHYHTTDLCVPADESFRAWLDSIPDHSGTEVDCASGNTDRDILVALYNATGGDDWTNNTNWLTEEPIGNWHGVNTDSVGRVVSLSLEVNEMRGGIPPELGGLANLEQLRLCGNELTGTIPSELGDLSSLEHLWLHGNALTGAIPPELGDLSNLERLLLRENNLTGAIPSELGGLDSLTYLLVDNNRLSGPLPLELNGLPLQQFHYHTTDLCVPADESFRAWLDSIPNHSGTGVACATQTSRIRLDFDDPGELDGWSLSSTTAAEVTSGVLELGSTETGGFGLVWDQDAFDPPVSNWTADARMGRADTAAFATLWLETNHSRYQTYAFHVGSGHELGPDTAKVDTNWRIFFWDNDRDGPGEGGWIYFLDYGYGTSDAINDLVNGFTEMTFALSGDSLRIHAGATPVFAAPLPTRILDAGATAIQGVWMAMWPRTSTTTGTALFDWIDISGEVSGGGNAIASAASQMPALADKAAAGAARPVQIRGNRRRE